MLCCNFVDYPPYCLAVSVPLSFLEPLPFVILSDWLGLEDSLCTHFHSTEIVSQTPFYSLFLLLGPQVSIPLSFSLPLISVSVCH